MSLTIKNDKLVWQDEEIVTIELLSSEISSRISSDDFLASSLSSALYSEVSLERSARISVVESLSTVCSNILGATTEYSLDTLSELASARVSGDASLSNDLSSEVSSRISGTTSIHNLFTTALELNDLLVQGNTNILGNLTVTGTVTSVILNTLNVDIKDNLIGLNIGAAELSHNYKDTGIIYERGSEQKNIFSGFKENNDKYSIFYTSNNSDFSGNNLTNDGYVDLQVKNLEFFDGSCNSLVIQGTNVSVAISSETDARLSGDASLSTMFDLAGISLKNYGTENWTARDSSRAWIDIAIGSTGQYQAAVSYNNLYLSSNYGTTWTENTSAGSRNWNSIAISSNGQFITAIAGGDIYISINSGVNWTYTYKPFGRQYTSVCMSDNGQYQLVGGSNINPHVSYNYGYSWTPILYVYNWFVVGMSADGKYQFADSYESGLFYSVDYGANWNIMAEYPTGGVLKSISVSSTGQYVTVAEDSQIYISSNFGASWTQKETTKNWYSVAISGNGQIQLASLYNQGQIYISTDFGNTWVPKGTARIWCGGVAISSNGQYITGSVFNGQIYTYNSADSGLSSAITSLSTGLSTGLSSEISSRLSGDASLSIKLSEMAEGMSGDTTSSTELSSEVSSIRSLLGRPPIMSYTTLPSYLPTQMGYYGTFTGDLPAIKTGVTPGIFTLLTSTGLTLQPGNYIFNFQICYSISNTGYISNIYAGLTTSNIAFVGSGNFYVIGSQYIPSPRSFPNVLYNVCRHLQVATETTFYLATSIMFEGSEMQILGSNNYATFLKVG